MYVAYYTDMYNFVVILFYSKTFCFWITRYLYFWPRKLQVKRHETVSFQDKRQHETRLVLAVEIFLRRALGLQHIGQVYRYK